MPTFLEFILYEELKNKKYIFQRDKKNKFEENKNKFEENKKYILDSFVNYQRLELIKKYKIQTYQFLMNKNYRNIFIKFCIIPLTFKLSYDIFLTKYKM